MNILTARILAEELAIAPATRLRELSDMPEVSLSVFTLSSLQNFFNNFEQRKPTSGELIFFNSLSLKLSDFPRYYAAGRISVNEKYIADTLADMMTKYSFFYPGYSSPCTLKKSFELGGEATVYGKARGFSMSDLRMFSAESDEIAKLTAALNGAAVKNCQNGICTAEDQYPHHQKKLRSGSGYAVSVIYSKDGSNFENMLEFAYNMAESRSIITSFAADGSKAFCEICERSKKLSIKAERLPKTSFEEADTSLAESEAVFSSISDALFSENGFGKCAIVIISKRSVQKRIAAAAGKMGLEICDAIEITKEPKFTVSSNGKIISSLRSDILRIAFCPYTLDVEIPRQASKASIIPNAKTVYESKETREAIYMTELSVSDPSAAFISAINAVISPFISAAYNGANTKNSEFSISVNLKLSMADKASVGISYATLLGVYKAITEMGAATENSDISLTELTPSLSVSLRVHTFCESGSLSTSLSTEELFRTFTDGDGLPDFTAVRALINGKNP